MRIQLPWRFASAFGSVSCNHAESVDRRRVESASCASMCACGWVIIATMRNQFHLNQ